MSMLEKIVDALGISGGVRPDTWIRKMALGPQRMIEPFSESVDGPGIVSYGLQADGYDARLDPNVKIVDWTRICGKSLSPLHYDNEFYVEKLAAPAPVILPPNTFMVGRTLEYFRIPRGCSVRGVSKCAYTEKGINIDIAGIHAGWEGRLTLHISNTTKASVKIYGNMGIVFLEFHKIIGRVERDYSQRRNPRFQEHRP